MSGYLYPTSDNVKRVRARRLWLAMIGENDAGRKNRLREIWAAILQSEPTNKNRKNQEQ